jgi:two-component system response regulator YesN
MRSKNQEEVLVMRQVMVVDDERWIRRGLIGAIPWEELGLTLAGEAEDGEDAYQLALQLKPDLMFLDMRMPGLDGRELLRLLAAELPELITIVVSGYSDFEYTKEAIRHNAFDYLLKPLKKDELHTVLGKALAELERRERMRTGAKQTRWQNWLWQALFVDGAVDGLQGERADHRDADLLYDNALLLVARPDSYEEGCERAAVLEGLQRLLEQERAFYCGGAWGFCLTKTPASRGELALCLLGGEFEGRELLRLLHKAQAMLKELAGTSYSIGYADAAEPIAQLRDQYRRIRQALGGKKLGETEVTLAAGNNGRQAGAAAYPRELEQAVLLQVQLGAGAAALEAFERWYAAIAGDGVTVEELQRSVAILAHALEKQLQEAGSSLKERSGKSLLAYTELIGQLQDRRSVRQLLADDLLAGLLAAGAANLPGGSGQGEQAVRDIQKLIQLHYAQPLSLHQIAEGRFMNAEYLSRLFKKTTGSNFVDYLTDYRIARAMEFMQGTSCKNYEIAKRVGYEDYRYFSQIFKKKTGMTIGEYRTGLEMNK